MTEFAQYQPGGAPDFEEEYSWVLEDEEFPETEIEDSDEFHIRNDILADWAVRKIQAEREENQRLNDLAEKQIADIELRVRLADERLVRRTAFLTSRLAEYFGTVPHRETRTQEQYQLLSGKLVYTKPKETFEKDDAALLSYLKESGNAEYVRVEEKPAWGEFKKRLAIVDGNAVDTATGEVVGGVSVKTSEAKFEVK